MVHLYKMNKEIDFYFFEEFYMERKDLNDKEYYANELDKIIKYIDYMNLASGKRLNTQELIDKKTNYYLNWILNLFHTKKYLKFRE